MINTNEYSQENVDKMMAESKALEDSVLNSKIFVSRRYCAGVYVAGCNGRVFEITKCMTIDGDWWIVAEIGIRNYSGPIPTSDPIPTYKEAREEARLWAEEE